jgi:lysophospholipase L1-like esterase
VVLPRLLLALQLIVLALIGRQWAYVTTYRLYLDRADAATRQSTATQQFELAGRRVVPHIVTREPERLVFPSPSDADVTLHAELQPIRPLRYEIAWRTASMRTLLVSGFLDARASITQSSPAGGGSLELQTDGPATWIDPRVVRGMHVRRHVVLLTLLVLASWLVNRRSPPEVRQALRLARFKIAALTVAAGITLLACEATLRALGDRAPAGVLALRHDLGENTPDERWEDSIRYGRRLRANVDAHNAWQYGDIVRMGFIPASVSPGSWHRFPFKTDAEGFRNPAVRERFEIAVLGDSFTDALTVPAHASWPARLEQRLGVAVQNYGTAGFGPQQELLVLRDFVVRHHPSRVVLAYFAGNDIFDAERFERLQQGKASDETLGWQIKDVYSRADTWRVTSAAAASASWFARRQQPFVMSANSKAPKDESDILPEGRRAKPFDRGMFSVNVEGKRLQWAFMPPYLNTLNFAERELRERRGWQIVRDSVLAMQQTSRSIGADFIVMFLPFKSQVYWPLLEQSLTPADLRDAMSFYLEGNGRHIDVDAMRRNRLAQNDMMRDLCEAAGIPFLDTTPLLQMQVESGENVYFPDESHLNELGHQLVADALAEWLQTRPRDFATCSRRAQVRYPVSSTESYRPNHSRR